VAALNVDGLAHFDRFRDVIGVGVELSTLGATLDSVAHRLGLSVSAPPPQFVATDPYSFSDQVAFAEAGIPALLVNEGFEWEGHSREQAVSRVVEWGRAVYHSPRDDLAQTLDFEATRQHVLLLLALVLELAESDQAPRWLPGAPYAAAQLRARAEGR
jgi:Zn-dependent M28 family amino/carboxypeptidase